MTGSFRTTTFIQNGTNARLSGAKVVRALHQTLALIFQIDRLQQKKLDDHSGLDLLFQKDLWCIKPTFWIKLMRKFKFLAFVTSTKVAQSHYFIILQLYNYCRYLMFHSTAFSLTNWLLTSVTRFGNLLDFWQVFKAFGNNYFAQFSHILRQFL